jgi:hypothetical protein
VSVGTLHLSQLRVYVGTHREYRMHDSMILVAAKLSLANPEGERLMPSWNEADNPLCYRVDINREEPNRTEFS